jgi:hypothetical protein
VHEWSSRIVPILFSLGTIILIFAIADRVWDRRTALFVTLFAAFIPMSAYYGRIVNFESGVLFFIVLFAWAYLVWSETRNNAYFFLAIIAIAFGGLTDWPFFLVLPFFVIMSLVTREKIRETFFLFLFGCGIAAGYLVIKNILVGYQSGVSNWFAHIMMRSNIPAFIGNPEVYSQIIMRLWNNFSIAVILAAIGVIVCVNIFRKRDETCNKLTVKNLIPLVLLLFGISYLIIFLESTYIHVWQLYYLIPGVSLYAGFTISYLFTVTTKKRSTTLLVKLGSLFVIILFLVISVQGLITLHNGENFETYYFGSRINEWTDPGDYISIIGLINPITYYANRTIIQNPTSNPDLSQIKILKPKIVAFPSETSIDSPWSRQEIKSLLIQENYRLLTTRSLFELWVRDIVVPDILAYDIDSIEVRNPVTGENIPGVDTKGYVATSYFSDNRGALFEHPLSKGTLRTNYIIDIHEGSLLTFGIGLSEKTWDSGVGDGVQFDIYCQSGRNETHLFSQYIDPRNNPADRMWQYYSISLDSCAGINNKISFATSPGPKNNNAYDWAYWIDPKIVVEPRK